MTRPGLDYTFFQTLTAQIEKKSGDERKKLETLREKLLEITHRLDQRAEEDSKRASDLLDTLLAADDIQKATASHIQEIDDAFVQVLNRALQDANQKNDAVRMPKLQQIVAVLQQASAPPPELALLEELLDAADETALNEMLEKHAKEITPELSTVIANILTRSEEQAASNSQPEDKETIEKLHALYKTVLKFSMKNSMKL